jgi:hypothetical protein
MPLTALKGLVQKLVQSLGFNLLNKNTLLLVPSLAPELVLNRHNLRMIPIIPLAIL